MRIAVRPENEPARIQALLSYEILDTEAEAIYDDFVKLASYICQTPISLISLIDPTRQWFKAKVGCNASETSRDIAFCPHAILQPDTVFVVPNALEDPRFADNPLVTGDMHIRFYAGAPLVTPQGLSLGTLCAIDTKPRTLSDEQLHSLKALARQVVTQLELRRLTKELERQVEGKNKLFYMLSHDLRSPFSGILAFAQMLAEGAATLSPEEIQEYATIVQTSSEQLLLLIDNLLRCARFELGHLEYQPAPQNIDTTMNSLLTLFGGNAAKKNIALVYEKNPAVQMMADPAMLYAILQNLIGNAIKFTPENGQVTISSADQGAMIQISVTDNGVGVDSSKLAQLFEFAANRSTNGTAGEKGTGLGLLLCKEFVEKHGGCIRADSGPGKGTSIHFTLPRANFNPPD